MKILSWILIVFGCLLLTSIFVAGDQGRDDYFYMFSIAISFVVLGALGKEYSRLKYGGGVPTIIGAILLTFGLQFMVLALEQYFRGTDVELVRGGALASIIFILSGLPLIWYGHKAHKKRIEQDRTSL